MQNYPEINIEPKGGKVKTVKLESEAGTASNQPTGWSGLGEK